MARLLGEDYRPQSFLGSNNSPKNIVGPMNIIKRYRVFDIHEPIDRQSLRLIDSVQNQFVKRNRIYAVGKYRDPYDLVELGMLLGDNDSDSWNESNLRLMEEHSNVDCYDDCEEEEVVAPIPDCSC